MKNLNGYQIFLIIELARLAGIIPKNLEYDVTWAKGIDIYHEFKKSKFNNSNEGLYECMKEFVEDKKPWQYWFGRRIF